MKNICKFKTFPISIILLISTVSAAEVTLIPAGKIVTQDETFDLYVPIDPMGAAIAGAQMNIEFNNSMLHVNDILEGNLFKKNGISTSFYRGIIDNSRGMVINIYSAILGPFNVSSPETFIIINVTAKGLEGEAWINFSNVKICDPEGKYTVSNVTNGSINIKRIASAILPQVRFINGTVQDSATKAVLAGVTITTNTGITTTTDASGFYSLAVTESTYDIIAAFEPKYFPLNMINVMTSLSPAEVQDIELVKKPAGTITGSIKKS